MPTSALETPQTDPTPIFEQFRGAYATELLTAAVAHFGVFGLLAKGPRSRDELAKDLGIEARPAMVLSTALLAMGLLKVDSSQKLALTDLAREHLLPGGAYDVGDYVGLAAQSPGVLGMVERLRTNQPYQFDTGAAFIYRDGKTSAMEQAESARHFTLALAGRAKNVAPHLAKVLDLGSCEHLVDLGGGSGIYSIALLQKHPRLRATVLDRPEVLKVAQEFAREFGVADRLELMPGDLFDATLPSTTDAVLLSNVLHDWDVPQCQAVLQRCGQALPAGGRLFIHDVFLNDALDGPLAIALYSAALFTLTEGRAYSGAEYRSWLEAAGFEASSIAATLIHCGILPALKR